ncbi:MAG: DUF4340 domain-containing protein [Planctomycetota bacterium]|nr:DUF4340 domain-containing protein [Planctomycetota bacterium]
MKLSRLNWTLAVALLGLVALDVVSWPRSEAVRQVLPLFEAWAPGQVASLRIEQGAEGDFAEDPDWLVQRDAEGVFRLPAHHGYPARKRAVDFLIDGVASLNSMDLLSEDPDSHGTYGLKDDQAVRIQLLDEQGQVLADLLQGDKAPGGRAFYVRRSDSDRVYRAPNFVRESVRGNLLIWIESRWCNLDSELVQRIELRGMDPEDGTLDSTVLTREKGSRIVWKAASGETVAKSKVQLFLRALSLVTIKDVTGGDVSGGTGELPGIQITLTQAGGTTWTGRLLDGTSEAGREASIELPGSPNVESPGKRVFQLLLSPASAGSLEKTLVKLQGE